MPLSFSTELLKMIAAMCRKGFARGRQRNGRTEKVRHRFFPQGSGLRGTTKKAIEEMRSDSLQDLLLKNKNGSLSSGGLRNPDSKADRKVLSFHGCL